MKFAIGYQQPANGEPFSHIVSDYRAAVSEVYFSWPGQPSGRPSLDGDHGATDWGAQRELEENLHAIKAMGIRLDLLFNANCYGANAISAAFSNHICSIVDYMGSQNILPDIVTTTSPFVASVIKKAFPDIETRASVNMRLDSTLAMEYLADIFDSFHIRRDLQRDVQTVGQFHEWCQNHGKRLCMLANSGCLRSCPAQIFHDNMVAHDSAIACQHNVTSFIPHLCWKLYNSQKNFEEILRATWIRPEDIHFYEPYFDMVKLATRQHDRPRMVIGAYASGHFEGNLLDLLEPHFSAIFAPYIIDNGAFPEDWHDIAGKCAITCAHCGKCTQVLKKVLKKLA